MTVIKLKGGKMSADVDTVLAPLADELYRNSGARLMAIVELKHVDRNEPAPDEGIKPTVTLRITHLEVAHGEQEHVLRDGQKALYVLRTADGSLDPDGEVELSESTLRLTEGLLTLAEAARLRAGLAHFADLARARAEDYDADSVKRARHLRELADGLAGLIFHTHPEDEEG